MTPEERLSINAKKVGKATEYISGIFVAVGLTMMAYIGTESYLNQKLTKNSTASGIHKSLIAQDYVVERVNSPANFIIIGKDGAPVEELSGIVERGPLCRLSINPEIYAPCDRKSKLEREIKE